MNKSELEERLDQLEAEIAELLKWRQSCNILVAWWGGCLMAVFTAGSAVAAYYQEIKSWLQAFWAVK